MAYMVLAGILLEKHSEVSNSVAMMFPVYFLDVLKPRSCPELHVEDAWWMCKLVCDAHFDFVFF